MATWYVRPASYASGANNGTSYADAWQGWTNIVAASMSATDTLMVCGQHSYSSTITVPKAGTSLAAQFIIDGGYATDPGSISFVGNVLLNHNKSYIVIQNLAITSGTSNCIFANGTLSGLTFSNIMFVAAAGSNSALSFSGTTGLTYTDVVVDSCTFTGDVRNASNTTGAIHWLCSAAAATSVLTRFTITNNTFVDLVTGRAVIHLRTVSGVNAATGMVDMKVSGNRFQDVSGFCIELYDEQAGLGASKGLLVRNNTCTRVSESSVSSTGGCVSVSGFALSTSDGFGQNLIESNVASEVTGGAGVVNVFYGKYTVRFNLGTNIYTGSTTDGNGVLFDHGCSDSVAYSNTFVNLAGKDGVVNSGVGIMILDSTTVSAYNNLVVGCRSGVHLGNAVSGQSGSVYQNTFLGVREHGVYILATATPNNVPVKNNAFRAASGIADSVKNLGAAWTGEDYNAWQGFAAASGHSLGAHDQSVADLVVGAGGGPLVGSPLLGTGVTGLGVTRDFNLVQRRLTPTIGAFDQATLRTGTV